MEEYSKKHITIQKSLNDEAKQFYQTFYSGKDFKVDKKVLLDVDVLSRNFRLYFKLKTGIQIIDS